MLDASVSVHTAKVTSNYQVRVAGFHLSAHIQPFLTLWTQLGDRTKNFELLTVAVRENLQSINAPKRFCVTFPRQFMSVRPWKA